MIAGQELQQWLSSGERRDATGAHMERLGRHLRDAPLLAGTHLALDEAEGKGAEAILAVAADFLGRTEEIEALIGVMIEAARADPFVRPPLRLISSDLRTGLLLLDRPSLSIFLAVTGIDALAARKAAAAGPASITFSGQRAIYRFLKAGGATLSFWEAPEITADFSAGTSGSCRLVERRQIADGETIAVDGRRHSFVIEHAVADLVYLQAATPVGAAPLLVEYDSATLRFAGASSADEASSRIQMMLSLLRVMDRADAAPLFREVLKSPHFYARWHAMRELLALDAELALPCLREMAERDPHGDVRAAAAETLRAFFPEAADMEAEPCHG